MKNNNDFYTIKEAWSVFNEFMNKVERLNVEFNDPLLVESLIKGFTIKDALLLIPCLQFATQIEANPELFSEEQCEITMESLLTGATRTLNVFIMAGINVETPASKYLTDYQYRKICPILDDIKDNLQKLKKVFESNGSEIEDFWD